MQFAIDKLTSFDIIHFMDTNNLDNIVKIEDINSGPVRQGGLSPELIERIKKAKAMLFEVDSAPVEEVIEDFRHDTHPEQEVAIWETMASVYQGYVLFNPELTLGQKNDVFTVILKTSLGSDDFADIKSIDGFAIDDIVNLYKNARERAIK
jgi:hypothetical protein